MVPQPVLMHVKLMEAQTNQTISKLLALRKAENNGYPQVVAKREQDTGQSDSNGRKKDQGTEPELWQSSTTIHRTGWCEVPYSLSFSLCTLN